eukprot:13520427-Alexandrium_andersonii.AAC.1
MADVSTSEKKRKVKAEMGKDITHEDFESVAAAIDDEQPAPAVYGRPSAEKRKGGKPTPEAKEKKKADLEKKEEERTKMLQGMRKEEPRT